MSNMKITQNHEVTAGFFGPRKQETKAGTIFKKSARFDDENSPPLTDKIVTPEEASARSDNLSKQVAKVGKKFESPYRKG